MNMTWALVEKSFQEKLIKHYDQDEIKEIFLISTEHIASISRNKYLLVKDTIVPNDELDKISIILQQLETGKPIQHIIGKAFFYKYHFNVSEHTLIPRPETEELVDMIIKDQKSSKNLSIIDIGTGSGCIPISLFKNLDESNQYTAVDISQDALAVARLNAEQLDATINFINADILEWEYVFDNAQKFDIIVSNPPYITPKEKQEMHANVLNFEPHLALFIEESAPLLFYDHIADFALSHLKKDGTLYFEINQYLGQETVSLLEKKNFSDVKLFKDINGADRMIKARF